MLFLSFSVPSRSIRFLVLTCTSSHIHPHAHAHARLFSSLLLPVNRTYIPCSFLVAFRFPSPSAPLHPWLFVSYSLRSSYSQPNPFVKLGLSSVAPRHSSSVNLIIKLPPPPSLERQSLSTDPRLFHYPPSFPSRTPHTSQSRRRSLKIRQKIRTLGRDRVIDFIYHPPSFNPQEERPCRRTHASFDDCMFHFQRVRSIRHHINPLPTRTFFSSFAVQAMSHRNAIDATTVYLNGIRDEISKRNLLTMINTQPPSNIPGFAASCVHYCSLILPQIWL